ncbi:LysR family transcriptional regulator [Hydrogenophaga sp.]|uniref:LysR family transcriptional regulator n=1 Tax=Hydrogenophaga sp. TaxID=1904254 RepID=UPI00262D6478|nr:LysR family transcriptional regulator [Hydrogenophaga sp.]MCW5655272.1 LysR family transcriptional regulator [Hydrogenophaga sp.]
MELTDIDLNQLVLFQQLMTERKVSRVADNLGLTQPAVSNALAKLRRALGDELFLRTPQGMVPTPYAEQLAEPVGYALGMIHSGLNQQTRFEPGKVKGSITIAMTDIGEIVFLPALVERLAREAPGLVVNTVRNTAVNLREDMESGRVDLAIGLLPQLKSGFFQRRLFMQRYVCLLRKGHPLAVAAAARARSQKKAQAPLSLAEFRAAEHLVIVSAGTGHGKVDDVMRRAGIDRTARLTVPHFVSVGHILQGSDLIATVPERLAHKLAKPFGLVALPHPVKLPDIAINVFWHAKVHRSPAHQWWRGVLFDMFGEGGGG